MTNQPHTPESVEESWLYLEAEEHDFYHIYRGLLSLGERQRPMLEHLGFYDTSTETLSRYGLALIIEVGEFLNETPWKKWKRDPAKPADLERMLDEFVDMLSFIGSWINFMRLMGIEPHNIAHAYREKLKANNKRFGVPDV